jgi:hypothetical protein
MTPTLTPTELLAVNQGRYERGLPPLAVSSFPRTVQAAARTIIDQRYTPPPSRFAQDYVNAIAVRLGKKRFTKPSTAEGEPGDFAEALRRATERRRRGYPKSQPKTN